MLGGLREDIHNIIQSNSSLLQEIVRIILNNNFPESIHSDIIAAVGINFKGNKEGNIVFDIDFRNRVLTVYEYKCAVCGFDIRLDNIPIGLEAAHIKWRQASGPSIEQNGLALCTLHHKFFDRGVFSINTHHVIELSERCYGTSGFGEWLLCFIMVKKYVHHNPKNISLIKNLWSGT